MEVPTHFSTELLNSTPACWRQNETKTLKLSHRQSLTQAMRQAHRHCFLSGDRTLLEPERLLSFSEEVALEIDRILTADRSSRGHIPETGDVGLGGNQDLV